MNEASGSPANPSRKRGKMSPPLDTQPVLDRILASVQARRLPGGAGRYARRPGESTADPLASAAAATLLHMLAVFPGRGHDRSAWVEELRRTQNPETGLCSAPLVGDLEATAAISAALDLFEQRLDSPPRSLAPLADPPALPEFLAQQDWACHPIAACRNAAALYTILTIAEEVGPAWNSTYFRWLREETDEHTGLLRRDCLSPIEVDGQWTLLPYLNAQYYILATQLHARQPHPVPFRLVDTALEIMEYHRGLFCQKLGHRHLPWIFCLTRSIRLSPHRHEEVILALDRFATRYVEFITQRANEGHLEDLTLAQTAVAALAELQIALPGRLISRRPLRQVLDRICFL